jgi:hypothetical protein
VIFGVYRRVSGCQACDPNCIRLAALYDRAAEDEALEQRIRDLEAKLVATGWRNLMHHAARWLGEEKGGRSRPSCYGSRERKCEKRPHALTIGQERRQRSSVGATGRRVSGIGKDRLAGRDEGERDRRPI